MFRVLIYINILVISPFLLPAQNVPPVTEQQLENMTAAEESETEDDSFLQQLAYYKRHPLNINKATAADLQALLLLTDLQIENLMSYRKLLGKLVHLYELQAIPTWDIVTIRKLLPFITVSGEEEHVGNLRSRLKNGEHHLVARVSQAWEWPTEPTDDSAGTRYQGGAQRYFLRYRYTFKNLLQYGLTADKDAGEQFFRGAQSLGFDFYSAHFFIRQSGFIKALAIGDYTVNMGQGLIQWQTLAFKKSTDINAVKRQSPVLKPYTSAGEYNFHRGIGITLQKQNLAVTLFASLRKLSINGSGSSDTLETPDFFSSFVMSGYHRTATEAAGKNQLRQTCFGGSTKYYFRRAYIGVNALMYAFSMDLQKRELPYNYFALNGKNWMNASIDYGWTHKNLHFFGEAAIDKKFNAAFVNGIMISIDKTTDLALLQRHISPYYQAINANAFTENTSPTNETGYYMGMTMRPAVSLRLDMYADLFRFPWLRYLVDAPSRGSEYALQFTYTPAKASELYLRFRREVKQINQPDNTTHLNYLVNQARNNWRLHLTHKLNSAFTLRSRVEWLLFKRDRRDKEQGMLYFIDVLYRPLMKPLTAGIRLQYFETDSYYSRVYAFENDVLYSYSIPVFYDRGYRYYININYDLTRRLKLWLRWGQLLYASQNPWNGYGNQPGKRKAELKLQMSLFF